MRRTTIAVIVLAVAACAFAAPAMAHQGDPRFDSVLTGTGVPGLKVQVLNYGDRLLLQNRTGRTVTLEGYENEPYARLLPDGTVSLYDNGTLGLGPGRQPRNVRYVIDTQAMTATFAGVLTDSEVTASGCCGSTRLLPGGNVVTGWGGTPQIAEYASDGSRLFRISGTFVYRGTPILPGSFTAQQFRDGMDTQFATGVTAQAAEPPANLANSPLAATLRSMQCCSTPR